MLEAGHNKIVGTVYESGGKVRRRYRCSDFDAMQCAIEGQVGGLPGCIRYTRVFLVCCQPKRINIFIKYQTLDIEFSVI